jgi:hypothetical protein
MAPLLTLRAAARRIGVSPGRLYRAIADGRLQAAPGGRPGKPTLVSLEAVQTFCQREGLRIPDETEVIERSGPAGRAEHSIPLPDEALVRQTIEALASQYLARIMERQSVYLEAFLREELSHLVARVAERVVDQVVERLAERFTSAVERSERAERLERPERPERSIPAMADPKAAVLQRLRALKAEGFSLQAMANRLNAEGVPTLSGKGRWQKGTIGNLLAQGENSS